MPILLAIKSLALSTAGKYVMVAVGAFVMLTWLRGEWVAPYKAEIAQLRKAAEDREKIEGEDRRRAAANAALAKELQDELDAIITAAAKPSACRLSPDELKRLQHLARRRSG